MKFQVLLVVVGFIFFSYGCGGGKIHAIANRTAPLTEKWENDIACRIS